MVDDRLVPGTLNAGHALPTIAQALIYIAIVEVDFTTLALLIAAAVAGRLARRGHRLRLVAPRGANRHGHCAVRRRRLMLASQMERCRAAAWRWRWAA